MLTCRSGACGGRDQSGIADRSSAGVSGWAVSSECHCHSNVDNPTDNASADQTAFSGGGRWDRGGDSPDASTGVEGDGQSAWNYTSDHHPVLS